MDALRLATLADRPAIEALMKASIREIFPAFYDARQTASSILHIGHVDEMLIDDGTYFLIEDETGVIASGGWSWRDKLYTGSGPGLTDARSLDPATDAARVRAMFVRGDRTRRGLGTRILEACKAAARAQGFTRLALMSTMPGLQLYQHFGFVVIEMTEITLPDGVRVAAAAMEMPIRG